MAKPTAAERVTQSAALQAQPMGKIQEAPMLSLSKYDRVEFAGLACLTVIGLLLLVV